MLISKHSATRHTAAAKKLLQDKKSEQQQLQNQTQSCLLSKKREGTEKSVNINTNNLLPMPRQNYQQPHHNQSVKYIPSHQQYTAAHQSQQAPHKPIPINSQPPPLNIPTPAAPPSYQQQPTNRSPLSNIKNIKIEPITQQSCHMSRGMKRSHSDTSMEKENHKRSKRSTTPDCSKVVEFKPIIAPTSEKREFQFQQGSCSTPSWNANITLDNTNIAVLQKGADGKLTRISNIPLKALIGNLEVYKMKESTATNETNPKHTEVKRNNTLNQNPKPNNQSEFSYMKLLQEETIESYLLNTFDNNNNKEIKQNDQSNVSKPHIGSNMIDS